MNMCVNEDFMNGDKYCYIKDKRIEELERMIKTADENLLKASEMCGEIPLGCDTPEHLAEKIMELRARIDELQRLGLEVSLEFERLKERVSREVMDSKFFSKASMFIPGKPMPKIEKTDYWLIKKKDWNTISKSILTEENKVMKKEIGGK